MRNVRHRQRGQTIVMAAVAMVAMVGALAMVVDGGMFMIISNQFQSAADAAALAGAWHDPICPATYAPQGCLPTLGAPFTGSPPTASCDGVTNYVVCDVANANAQTVAHLCGSPIHVTVATGTRLNVPANVNTIVVTVQCDAQYSFGRILDLGSKGVSSSAAAAVGDRNANNYPICNDGGDMTDFKITRTPFCGFIARLID